MFHTLFADRVVARAYLHLDREAVTQHLLVYLNAVYVSGRNLSIHRWFG